MSATQAKRLFRVHPGFFDSHLGEQKIEIRAGFPGGIHHRHFAGVGGTISASPCSRKEQT